MRAFSDDSVAVQNALISPRILCRLLCQNIGDQIQRFDITVQESGILLCDTAQGAIGITDLRGAKHDRKIGGDACLGEGMGAEIGSAGKLKIHPLISLVQFFYKIIQEICKLGFGQRWGDFEKLCALKEPVYMLFQGKNAVIEPPAGYGFITDENNRLLRDERGAYLLENKEE